MSSAESKTLKPNSLRLHSKSEVKFSNRMPQKHTLFDALGGSYTIPTDQAGLRKLFDYFDKDKSQKIDFREFSKAYAEFEEEMGLPVSKAAIAKKFRAAGGDNLSMSFEEFCQFMLHRAATG